MENPSTMLNFTHYGSNSTDYDLNNSFNDTLTDALNDETTSDSLICTVTSTTCDCHSFYQFYNYEEKLMLGLISLPIISFGLCANILSVCIFTHRVMRSSSINWYLAILSFSDTIILLSAFFVLALPRFGEYLIYWKATSIR
uniref:G-protein coupled receptors family 1 profile domain-containing protein n=1 Tax=Panagrolaimus sp. JU765 TaxID=591449 RepID=A0AC34QK84_9BILA